jgi:hypothetical protein
VKSVRERPVAVAWFNQALTMAAAAPSGAPAPRFDLAVVVQARAPPPSVESARESPVRWWRQ